MLQLSPRTLDAILPPPPVNSFEWICENAYTKRGMPFDYLSYPWTKGICEAWDNPAVERIFFQAGSRLGKTELGLSLLECGMANSPDIAMIGGPTDTKVAQWIKDRLIPMMEFCTPLATWLPPPHRRPPHTLHLRHGTIYGAWSGSPTTLGDLDPRYLFGFEIDKFTKASSEEADSLMLLLERGAEIPNRRVMCESTPTIAGKSRIDKYVSQGTDCRFHVPCPYCHKFQPLELGAKGGDFGLIWDRLADGSSDAALAFKTARYRCKFCLREIDETKRFVMVQKGVWCPRGCQVDKKGHVRGTLANDGPDASYQIGRLYGPSFTFGRYARAFVNAAHDDDVEALRSFKNNWEGVCWAPNYALKGWEEVSERLCSDDVSMRVVPQRCQFVTMGVDVQVDHFVFITAAWARHGKGSVINYGIVHSWDDVRALIDLKYQHADGGPVMSSMFNLIDARDGNRTDEVTSFCKSINIAGRWVLPCMGSQPNALRGKSFTKQKLDEQGKLARATNRRGVDEFYLITVATNYYQNWIHNALNRRLPSDQNSIVFPGSARFDEDLFDQLLSEYPEWSNDDKCKWVKKSPTTINDFRDTLRYVRCAADVAVNNNWSRVASARVLTEQTHKPLGEGIPVKPPKQAAAGPDEKKTRWVRRLKVRR